ncbi:MAG TPA: FAD-dependent oxidoreductase [Candidatus Acidoferrales bacterium]|nr:FAD-dependent oxidoreductase [Candidatus Acidoferrales bacterium]
MEGSPASLPIRTSVRSKNEPVAHVEADICVVGAGISGISAAVEAARLGRKVLLVDGQPSLGGQAVNSIIGTFCGLYSNGPNARQLTHGIADDILRDLGAQGAARPMRGPMTITVYYDEVALSRWVETTVRAAGIKVVVGAILREVRLENRRITELLLATRYGDLRIAATGFVEATGDAALVWQAGLPCRQPDVPIYGTQIVVLEHLNEDHKPSPKDYSQRLSEKAKEYGLVRHDGFAFFFPDRGTAVVNMTHVQTPLDPVGASEKALDGKDQADRVVGFLKKEFPEAFGKARVRAYGLPGIRQTRWIVGRHQLTADEVRKGAHFPDEVARTAWPIELHGQPEGYLWEPFDDDHVHYVPLGSLVPADTDNVVAAGRCIDGDAAALSSVRVMGPCIAMGAAAAHALDLAGSGSVHQIDLAALRRRLIRNLEG